MAMATSDIVRTVTELKKRGVEFLQVPTTYYDTLLDRVGSIDEDLSPLKELGILVDRDNEGTFSNSLPSQLRIGQHYFLKLSSAKELPVLGRVILRHCLRQLSENRKQGETSSCLQDNYNFPTDIPFVHS